MVYEKMYNVKLGDDKNVLFAVPGVRQLGSTQRGVRSKYLPAAFNLQRKLTPSELEAEGYHSLEDGKPIFVQAKAGKKAMELFIAKWWSLQDLEVLGVSGTIAEIQRLSLAPDFKSNLTALATKKHNDGTKFNIAFVRECNHGVNSIHPSLLAKKEDPRVMQLANLISLLTQKVLESTPGAWTDEHEAAYHYEAWITCGDENNHCVSSIQMNYLEVGQKKAFALGTRAAVHDDVGDERRCPSVVLFLSYLPKNYFPGRFSMTSFRLTCTAAPLTLLVIDANYPHGGSGDGPYPEDLALDSPLRYQPPIGFTYPALPEGTPYNRLYIIPYHRWECARAITKCLGPDTLDGGLGGFVTHRNMMTFRMRHAIRDRTDIGIANPTAEDFCNAFSFEVDGEMQFPYLHVAQICLEHRDKDHPEWADMLKAAKYQTVHIRTDDSKYDIGKKRKALEEIRGHDGPRYCTDVSKRTGEKCQNPVKTGIPGPIYCHAHGKKRGTWV